MSLGRNEKLHLSCEYAGREYDCPKECEKCAISIKTDADYALANGRLGDAINLYKRSVSVEPQFAEAWCNLANAFGMNSEYKKALSAFNKALSIDPQYGKAMFGKAITLRNLGELEAALMLANETVALYEDSDVLAFKKKLEELLGKDNKTVFSLQQAIDMMTEKAYEILDSNGLLGPDEQVHTIRSIDQKTAFSKKIYEFCKKQYNSLEKEKIWSKSMDSAFYGSLYITLKYYQSPTAFSNVSPFEYLQYNTNLGEPKEAAERALGIRDNALSQKIKSVIYEFVTYSLSIIANVEPVSNIDAAVLDATENGYIMGMTVAMSYYEHVRGK